MKLYSLVGKLISCTLAIAIVVLGLGSRDVVITSKAVQALPMSTFGIADLSNVENLIPTTDPFDTGIQLPDWSRISFGNLPNLAEGGELSFPSSVTSMLGYDPSRTWTADTPITEFIKMGDLENALNPQEFSLEQISNITQVSQNLTGIPHQGLDSFNLDDFGLSQFQSLETLREVVPDLDVTQLIDMPPVLAVAASKVLPTTDLNGLVDSIISGEGLTGALGDLSQLTLGDFLDGAPDISFTELGELGSENLVKFGLSSIPGLNAVPLGQLEEWRGVFLEDIPNLEGTPMGEYPDKLTETDFALIGRVDVPLGPDEESRQRSLTGSYQAGFSVPCEENCMHMELGDVAAGILSETNFDEQAEGLAGVAGGTSGAGVTPGRVTGRQWIGGQQLVEGGFGVLQAVGGGLEPTGRNPYGSVFKQVLWKVDPAAGMVQTAMYFRYCHRGIPDLGCTPYIIGPIPFLPYAEKQPIFLGIAAPSDDGKGIDGAGAISGLDGSGKNAGATGPVPAPQPCPPGMEQSDCVMLNPLPSMSGAGIYSRFRRRRPGHDGVDIQTTGSVRNCQGTVVAPDDGVVIHAGAGYGGYGYAVAIYHPHRQIATFMSHLCSNIRVSKGQQVSRGQAVGQEGGYGGNRNSPSVQYYTHLHFEVHAGENQTHGLDGVQVDPESYQFTNKPMRPIQDLFG